MMNRAAIDQYLPIQLSGLVQVLPNWLYRNVNGAVILTVPIVRDSPINATYDIIP